MFEPEGLRASGKSDSTVTYGQLRTVSSRAGAFRMTSTKNVCVASTLSGGTPAQSPPSTSATAL